jgi:hypothetical protein
MLATVWSPTETIVGAPTETISPIPSFKYEEIESGRGNVTG